MKNISKNIRKKALTIAITVLVTVGIVVAGFLVFGSGNAIIQNETTQDEPIMGYESYDGIEVVEGGIFRNSIRPMEDDAFNMGEVSYRWKEGHFVDLNAVNLNVGGSASVSSNLDVDGGTLYVDAATNRVGIGTTTPDSLLHIKGNIPGTVGSHPAGQLIIQNPTDSVFSNVVITAYESDGAGNPDQQLWYLGSSSGSNSDIILENRRNSKLQLGTNGAAKMTILGDGNIGIGTASPGDKLTVYNATASVSVRVQSAGPDADAGVVLRTATAPYWTIYEDESDSQKFIIRDSVGGDRLTIDTSGNVGIGTTDLTVKFEVAGAASISGNFDMFGTFTANTAASHSFAGDLAIGDDFEVDGTASISGNSYFGNILPHVTNAYDLGTPALRWRAIYVSSGSFHIGDTTIKEVDGELVFEDKKGARKLSEMQFGALSLDENGECYIPEELEIKKITTDELCINETCMIEEELRELLDYKNKSFLEKLFGL